jgi:hypothetical protein
MRTGLRGVCSDPPGARYAPLAAPAAALEARLMPAYPAAPTTSTSMSVRPHIAATYLSNSRLGPRLPGNADGRARLYLLKVPKPGTV